MVDNIGRIMARHCVMSTLRSGRWDTEFHLDDFCNEELYFWKTILFNINKRYCFAYTCPSSFLYSDASATGCGSVFGLSTYAIKCERGMILRAYSVPPGGSFVRLSFLLLLFLKYHMSSGLLIIKLLPELLKLVA